MYIVEYSGDISGRWIYDTFAAALQKVESDFPAREQVEKEYGEEISYYNGTPDPEDDKIEILEYHGQKLVPVWGFYGWHWEMPEGMEQGKLPGHELSLYEEAMAE